MNSEETIFTNEPLPDELWIGAKPVDCGVSPVEFHGVIVCHNDLGSSGKSWASSAERTTHFADDAVAKPAARYSGDDRKTVFESAVDILFASEFSCWRDQYPA